MKRIVLLITLLLAVKGYSQHLELLDVEWFLHKIVIEGEDIIPPPNGETQNITCIFEEHIFSTEVCALLAVEVEYFFEDSFFNLGCSVIGVMCSNDVNQIFEDTYFNFYCDYENFEFTYTITTDSNGDKALIVINNNGDEAHYGNVPLSVEEFDPLLVTIYPNPVKEVLFIKSKENISSITVFDIYGKAVRSVAGLSSNQTEINLGSLQSGVYFVTFLSENGRKLTRKVIKK